MVTRLRGGGDNGDACTGCYLITDRPAVLVDPAAEWWSTLRTSSVLHHRQQGRIAMKGLAIISLAAMGAWVSDHKITIGADGHGAPAADCTGVDPGEPPTDYQPQFVCTLSQELPFDSLACFFNSIRIIERKG